MSETELMKEGDGFRHIFNYSQETVEKFAKITGDDNPLHLDADYAAGTVFKRPIIHGMLGAGVFSKVLGTIFPGRGTIYMQQEIKFLRPIYAGTDYEAVFKILSVNRKRHSAVIETKIVNVQTGKRCTDGQAEVMNVERL